MKIFNLTANEDKDLIKLIDTVSTDPSHPWRKLVLVNRGRCSIFENPTQASLARLHRVFDRYQVKFIGYERNLAPNTDTGIWIN